MTSPKCLQQVPGSATALVYAWRKDNSGPANASEVIADFAAARRWFPGAEVTAGTFDEYVDTVMHARRAALPAEILPVIEQDMSDSWLMGMASDPIKTQQAVAINSAVAEWLRGGGEERATVPSFRNFTRQFIKSGEHTWGLADKYIGRELATTGWSNAEFHPAINTNSRLALMASSWMEQRTWAIGDALDALARDDATAPLLHDIRDRIASQKPEADFAPLPGMRRLSNATRMQERLAGWLDLQLGRNGGFSAKDVTRVSPFSWTAARPLAQLRYQTLNHDSYVPFQRAYLVVPNTNKSCYDKPGQICCHK